MLYSQDTILVTRCLQKTRPPLLEKSSKKWTCWGRESPSPLPMLCVSGFMWVYLDRTFFWHLVAVLHFFFDEIRFDGAENTNRLILAACLASASAFSASPMLLSSKRAAKATSGVTGAKYIPVRILVTCSLSVLKVVAEDHKPTISACYRQICTEQIVLVLSACFMPPYCAWKGALLAGYMASAAYQCGAKWGYSCGCSAPQGQLGLWRFVPFDLLDHPQDWGSGSRACSYRWKRKLAGIGLLSQDERRLLCIMSGWMLSIYDLYMFHRNYAEIL